MSPLRGSCKHLKSDVVDSRQTRHKHGPLSSLGVLRYRKRKCRSCGKTWATYEITAEAAESAGKAVMTLTIVDRLISGDRVRIDVGKRKVLPNSEL